MLNHISNAGRHRIGARDVEEMFVASRTNELLEPEHRNRLIEVINEAWSGEQGVEPAAIARLLAEFLVQMKSPSQTSLALSSGYKIQEWLEQAVERFVRHQYLEGSHEHHFD